MFDNLKDGIIFHLQVLDRLTSPVYIAVTGLLVAFVLSFIFEKFEFSIYNSKLLRPLLEKNLVAWNVIVFMVPIIISLTFIWWAWQKHQSNIKRFTR